MANLLSVAGADSKYKILGAAPAGFWAGLWHGIIAPFTFFISLFNPNVSMFETHNNGRWYEFGFLVGFCGTAGGGGASSNQITPR